MFVARRLLSNVHGPLYMDWSGQQEDCFRLNAHCSSGKQKAQGQVSRAKWFLQRVISAAISEDLALHAGATNALLRV